MTHLRSFFLALSASMMLAGNAFPAPLSVEGRLNRDRSSAPAENAKKPSGVSKDVWSPNGSASADSVTSSIGYSMIRWSAGIGIAALILSLAFSTSTGSQHAHSH